MPISVERIPAGCGMMYTGDWLVIARDLVGRDEVARVIAVYYRTVSTSEEACGRMYLQRLRDRHPSHAARIDRLTTVPGIGAYIMHWFLEQSGGLCR